MKKVLNVGQCDYDHSNITKLVSDAGGSIERAATKDEALALLTSNPSQYSLVLVNRLLDIDHSEGIEVLRAIKADATLAPINVMIVSDIDDAQKSAVSEGAMLGFGKQIMKDDDKRSETVSMLKDVLATNE